MRRRDKERYPWRRSWKKVGGKGADESALGQSVLRVKENGTFAPAMSLLQGQLLLKNGTCSGLHPSLEGNVEFDK